MVERKRNLQILREIDKLDKIGLDGVCAMLGDGLTDASGAFNKGVGLDPLQVGMMRLFLSETAVSGEDSLQSLKRLENVFAKLTTIRCRVILMTALEGIRTEGGSTAWDRLIDMPSNNDQSWSGGGRPRNMAICLDDLVIALRPMIERAMEAQ